jgi:hypothetical protein
MFQMLKKVFGGRPAARAAKTMARQARLEVETLEDRRVLSTMIAPLPTLTPILNGAGRLAARSDNGTVVRVWTGSDGLHYSLANSSGSQWATGLVPGTNRNLDSQATVAMGNNGRFVIAWTHVWSYSPYDLDVRAQVFDANGNTVGGTQWVAASGNVEDSPSAGMDQYGDFVVAYRYVASPTTTDIYARTFDPNGNATGTELVGSGPEVWQPSAAMNRYGQYVVAFEYDVAGGYTWVGERTYNLYGQSLGSAWIYQVFAPSAAIDASGNVGLAYTYASSSGYQQVGVQRFSVTGQSEGFTPVGWAGVNQYAPSIGMADDGRFVVAYKTDSSSATSIFADEFSAGGTKLSYAYFVTVNHDGSNIAQFTVAMDAAGDFAIDSSIYYPYGNGITYEYGTLYQF